MLEENPYLGVSGYEGWVEGVQHLLEHFDLKMLHEDSRPGPKIGPSEADLRDTLRNLKFLGDSA